jgi:hypothetical protein
MCIYVLHAYTVMSEHRTILDRRVTMTQAEASGCSSLRRYWQHLVLVTAQLRAATCLGCGSLMPAATVRRCNHHRQDIHI